MNSEFLSRVKTYFKSDSDLFLEKLNELCTQGFFLNTKKADIDTIFSIIDFDYQKSDLTKSSFYHNSDNIGKTKAYELGLIYPQEIAASLPASFVDTKGIRTVVDMCASPGGKSINILNRLDNDVLLIANEYNHTRASVLSSNFERLGLDNVIITNKNCNDLASQLEGYADLVILDAPCSGEGMIRKYPEILNDYSIKNINHLSNIQSDLLENAYTMLKDNGQLLYSTCTYSLEEDEDQIKNFLSKHSDMSIINLGTNKYSYLDGTLKFSPINNTEGQFICLMRKNGVSHKANIKYLKPIKEKLVDEFITSNLDISDYFLYKYNDYFYISFIPLPDLGRNIMKLGICVGEINNKRFKPCHNLYRSNLLTRKYKYTYNLNDNDYIEFVRGNEIKTNLDNGYYLLTYNDLSIGFGKCSNFIIKNKYPKGLRTN